MTREILQIIGNNQSQGQATSLEDLYNLMNENRDDVRRRVKYLEGKDLIEWWDTGIKMTTKGLAYYGEWQ